MSVEGDGCVELIVLGVWFMCRSVEVFSCWFVCLSVCLSDSIVRLISLILPCSSNSCVCRLNISCFIFKKACFSLSSFIDFFRLWDINRFMLFEEQIFF